jgi:hypothetical protein
MSRSRVAVLQIVSKQLTVTAAAAEYGISRRHLHRLLVRYQEGGLDALEPRSRRPEDDADRDARDGPSAGDRVAWRIDRGWVGCRAGHDRLVPRARGAAGALDIDYPPDLARGGFDHTVAQKAAQVVLHAL